MPERDQGVEQRLGGVGDAVEAILAQLPGIDACLRIQSGPAQQRGAGFRAVEEAVQVTAENLLVFRARAFGTAFDDECRDVERTAARYAHVDFIAADGSLGERASAG